MHRKKLSASLLIAFLSDPVSCPPLIASPPIPLLELPYTKTNFSELVSILGNLGDIWAELESVYCQYGIDTSQFNPRALAELPRLPWRIPAEVSKRHYFTIRATLAEIRR